MMRVASRWWMGVSTAVRSNSIAASRSVSHLSCWMTLDSTFCEGGVGRLSLTGVQSWARGWRLLSSGSEAGRKRSFLSPSIV